MYIKEVMGILNLYICDHKDLSGVNFIKGLQLPIVSQAQSDAGGHFVWD
jgi:hypothetical protein